MFNNKEKLVLIISFVVGLPAITFLFLHVNKTLPILNLFLLITFFILFLTVNAYNKKISQMLSLLNTLIIVVDKEGKISYSNNNLEYDKKSSISSFNTKLTGKHISLFLPEITDLTTKLKSKRFESHLIKDKSSPPINVEISTKEVKHNDRIYYILMINDITNYKHKINLKTSTITNAGFKIRTLLSPIRGAFGLLLSGTISLDSAEAKKLLEMGSENCLTLIDLINNILEIEEIENNNAAVNYEKFDIVNMTKQTIISLKPNADEYLVNVELVTNSESIILYNDKAKIIQILIHLISNACKFSSKQSVVSVHLEQSRESVKIKVIDNGKGISINDIDKVFDKFYQSGLIPSGKLSGNGLGLTHSKAIVEMLNGTISVESKAGKGTIFSVELPLNTHMINNSLTTA